MLLVVDVRLFSWRQWILCRGSVELDAEELCKLVGIAYISALEGFLEASAVDDLVLKHVLHGKECIIVRRLLILWCFELVSDEVLHDGLGLQESVGNRSLLLVCIDGGGHLFNELINNRFDEMLLIKITHTEVKVLERPLNWFLLRVAFHDCSIFEVLCNLDLVHIELFNYDTLESFWFVLLDELLLVNQRLEITEDELLLAAFLSCKVIDGWNSCEFDCVETGFLCWLFEVRKLGCLAFIKALWDNGFNCWNNIESQLILVEVGQGLWKVVVLVIKIMIDKYVHILVKDHDGGKYSVGCLGLQECLWKFICQSLNLLMIGEAFRDVLYINNQQVLNHYRVTLCLHYIYF